MEKQIAIVLFLGCFLPCFAQASTTDSLEHKLFHAQGKEKIALLFKLSRENNGNSKAFHYIDLLQKEAEKQKDDKLEMQVMGLRIQTFVNTNQPDSTLKYATATIGLMRRKKEYKLMFSIQDLVIGQLISGKKFSDALKKVNEQFNEAKYLNNSVGMAIANKNLGLIYRCTGRSAEAARFYKEGIEWLDKADELSLKTDMYLDMITVNREQRKYVEALENCNKCFELLKQRTGKEKKDSEKSIVNAQYFTCLCLKAYICLELKQLKEAKECINKALKTANPSWTGVWLYPLWEAQMKYCIAINDYQEALKYHNLINQHNSKDNLNMLLFLINEKARIYVGMKQYREACKLYENAVIIKDSLYSVNFARQLDEVRSLYEVDKLEMKAEKNRLNTILLLSGLLALAIVCILLGVIVLIIRKNSKKLEEKNRKLFLQLKEKDVLQEKIERLSIQQPLGEENQKTEKSPEVFLFNRLQQWLETDKKYTNQKITPEEVAAKLSTNTRYLYDAIRQMTGQTFNDYINGLKLEYARKLLLSDKKNQLTIEGISTEAGFNTRSNFYRLFRLKYGLTPSELKKQDEESEIL